MIRFIDLTDQILDDTFLFAWYDTVRDEFVEIGNVFVWDSWSDFEFDYKHAYPKFTLDRFAGLFPKEVQQQHRGATAAAGGSEI